MTNLRIIPKIKPPQVESRPFWREYFIYSAEFLPLAAGTANAAPTALAFSNLTPALKMDSDSDFEFISTMYVATDPRVYLRLKDNTMGRYLHQNTLDLRNFAGQILTSITANGFVAYEWQTPYLIRAASSLSIEAADFSGSSNTVRVSFHGCKVRPGHPPYARAYKAKIHHVYNVDPTIVGANQTQVFTIPTDNDSDFMIANLTGSRTGEALVSIKNGRENDWMNIPVHFDNLVGNGNFPNVLKYPKFIRRGDVMTITVQDLSGSNNTMSFYLYGWKLFG